MFLVMSSRDQLHVCLLMAQGAALKTSTIVTPNIQLFPHGSGAISHGSRGTGVPLSQDVEQTVGVPVGVRQQVLLKGHWVIITGDVAEYIKKLIASVALLKRMADLAVVTGSQDVTSEREARTRDVADVCSTVKSIRKWTRRARSRSASRHLRTR